MDVMYYINGKPVSVYMDSLDSEGEEDLYMTFEGMDEHEVFCEHFFSVNYGFGACGYTQQHLLFYVSPTSINFVTKHLYSADGMYGGGTEFNNLCLGQSLTQIASVAESHEPDDKEEVVTVSYSDSTIYYYDGKTWNSKLITEKGIVFRTEKEKI